MKPKLAIALQVCPVDVEKGRRLIKLITDIEKNTRSDIEVIVAHRRDTYESIVEDMAKIARGIFRNVIVIGGKRMSQGWPEGCNDLWAETMMRISILAKQGKIESTGVLTFEADCLPMRPDWLDVLADAWNEAYHDGKEVLGTVINDPPHINGNAIFDVRITRKHWELNGSTANAGWDCFHGEMLLRVGTNTDLIQQVYRTPTITEDALMVYMKDSPAMLHGVKDDSGLKLIEEISSNNWQCMATTGMKPSGEDK